MPLKGMCVQQTGVVKNALLAHIARSSLRGCGDNTTKRLSEGHERVNFVEGTEGVVPLMLSTEFTPLLIPRVALCIHNTTATAGTVTPIFAAVGYGYGMKGFPHDFEGV